MNLLDKKELIEARELLLKGDVVAIPTETVYGLAASIDSETGLKKIFAIKERPFFDPLIVHVASFKQASKLVREWTPLADYLARTFWPGPLTLVLAKSETVNPLITSGLETVAVRMPAHEMARALIDLAGVPLAAPSANKFGKTSPTQAEHVRSEFQGETLLVLDGGECEVGLESTVVALENDSSEDVVKVLRPGAVTLEMLEGALRKWSRPCRVIRDESAASPGHLKHHYMPKIPLVILNQGRLEDVEKALGRKFTKPVELKLDSDPVIAARELYENMRRASDSGADLLYVHRGDHARGLWTAIWDRLERASTASI